MKTFVYIDHFKGEIQPASWEALGLGKSLGLGERSCLWLRRGCDRESRVRIWRG